jgi:hypothetical protein
MEAEPHSTFAVCVAFVVETLDRGPIVTIAATLILRRRRNKSAPNGLVPCIHAEPETLGAFSEGVSSGAVSRYLQPIKSTLRHRTYVR